MLKLSTIFFFQMNDSINPASFLCKECGLLDWQLIWKPKWMAPWAEEVDVNALSKIKIKACLQVLRNRISKFGKWMRNLTKEWWKKKNWKFAFVNSADYQMTELLPSWGYSSNQDWPTIYRSLAMTSLALSTTPMIALQFTFSMNVLAQKIKTTRSCIWHTTSATVV